MVTETKLSKLDLITMVVLVVSIIAITFSASAITWSLAKTAQMQETIDLHKARVNTLHTHFTVYEIYVQKLHADLEARGFNPPPLPVLPEDP